MTNSPPRININISNVNSNDNIKNHNNNDENDKGEGSRTVNSTLKKDIYNNRNNNNFNCNSKLFYNYINEQININNIFIFIYYII